MKAFFKSLAEFQQEVPAIHKGTQGFGYSYANLNQIFSVINPLLKKHKLGFTQLLDGENLKTIIFHSESGECLESTVQIPQGVSLSKMNTFQVMGSAITYYRRYALSAALGLVTDADLDAAGEEVKTEKAELTDSVLKSMLTAISKGKKNEVISALPKYKIKPEQQSVIDLALKN